MAFDSDYDSDKTIVMPLIGTNTSKEPPPFTAVAMPAQDVMASDVYIAQQTSLQNYSGGTNPFMEEASPLLKEMISIRSGLQEDQDSLRSRLESSIRAFDAKMLSRVSDRAQVMAARYILCTSLDESITTSNIGNSGQWSRHALLSTFHNETWGGEKFFQILDRCIQQPAQNLHLLELMYALISLGFEGKYRVMERGTVALEALRDKVYRQIRILRGDPPLDLSHNVERSKISSQIYRHVPLWVIVILAFICMSVSFFGFSIVLNKKTNTLYEQYISTESLVNTQKME